MLKLQLQVHEIGETLSTRDPALEIELDEPDEHNIWRDSSMELERGLDVVDLAVDLDLTEAQDALPADAPKSSTAHAASRS